MFLGINQHSLDTKGRITIPAKYREELGYEFYATAGLENCIVLYPGAQWLEFYNGLIDRAEDTPEVRAHKRLVLGYASEMEMDKQGRVMLSKDLRTWAGIEKELVISGAGARMEVWARDRWLEYIGAAEKSFTVNATKMVGLKA